MVALAVCATLIACDASPDLGRSRTEEEPLEPKLSLSQDKVPREIFHLDGLADDARFISNTTTGGFEVRPGLDVDAGTALELVGRGCADANSVYVVLYRVERHQPGQHDREQRWITTRRFRAGSRGWSGSVRLPARPEVAEYVVWAACELQRHAYWPSAWDVSVGGGYSPVRG